MSTEQASHGQRLYQQVVNTLHDATEAKAVEEVCRKVLQRRKRFSLNRLDD